MNKIVIVRGIKVMIDKDLAELYGVSTKRLNEQVKRNGRRFPKDFMFQPTEKEKDEVVAICDHLGGLKFSPNLPFAFAEYGAGFIAGVFPPSIRNNIQMDYCNKLFLKNARVIAHVSFAALG